MIDMGPRCEVVRLLPRKCWVTGDECETDAVASRLCVGGDGTPLDEAKPGEGELGRDRKGEVNVLGGGEENTDSS